MTTTDVSPSTPGSTATEPVPSSQSFTLVGIAYGMYAVGLLLIWPTLIGLVIAYVKRDDVPPLLASHYRWLINTFWWWLIAWTVIIAAMLTVIVPNAFEIDAAVRSGQILNISWELIGTGVFGGLAIGIVWLWVVYRLIRGTVRLSDGREVP